MTLHVPDRFKALNAFWIGLAKIGLTPAAVLSQARLSLTIYDGKKNLVTTAEFFVKVSPEVGFRGLTLGGGLSPCGHAPHDANPVWLQVHTYGLTHFQVSQA